MHIWAVGGGKGGTGKSLVSHGLGARLAERGASVILVDADFGGPNQHTYCGLRKPERTLGQFFEEKAPLADLVVGTRIPGLRLIPGNVNAQNTDGITFAEKAKLFRHLRKLPAEHVILDLGAGTSYDVLDSFLEADVQVCVIAPDALAIENVYLFLKNVKYRQMTRVLSETGLGARARELWKHRMDHGIATVDQFLERLKADHAAFGERMAEARGRLGIQLVLNQIRDMSQTEVGVAVSGAIQRFLGLPAACAGHVRHEKDLWRRPGPDVPVLHPGAAFTLRQDLEAVTEAILAARVGPRDAHG